MTKVKLRRKLGERRIRQLYNLTTWIGVCDRNIGGDEATIRRMQKILGVKFND